MRVDRAQCGSQSQAHSGLVADSTRLQGVTMSAHLAMLDKSSYERSSCGQRVKAAPVVHVHAAGTPREGPILIRPSLGVRSVRLRASRNGRSGVAGLGGVGMQRDR